MEPKITISKERDMDHTEAENDYNTFVHVCRISFRRSSQHREVVSQRQQVGLFEFEKTGVKESIIDMFP